MEVQHHAWKSVILVILRSVDEYNENGNIINIFWYMWLFLVTIASLSVISAAFQTKINGWNSCLYCTRSSFQERIWWQGNLDTNMIFINTCIYVGADWSNLVLLAANIRCFYMRIGRGDCVYCEKNWENNLRPSWDGKFGHSSCLSKPRKYKSLQG